MSTTNKWIIGFLLLGCFIYALSPGPGNLVDNPTRWEIREQVVFLTGVCAMSLMVLAMIISVRFKPVNRLMGGLDKAYVVHKWTGIITLVLAVLHWLMEYGANALVLLNIVSDPGELGDESLFSELQITLFQIGVLVAEITFYVFIVLVAIALIKKIPYHYFRITHKAFPVVFLLLAYHAATAQLKEFWLSSPAGYLLFILLGIGSVAALIGLFQQIGSSRKVKATVKDVEQYGPDILDIRLETSRHFIHQAGQYAFLQFDHHNEPHPLTIASSGDNPNMLRFAVKELGDFTNQMKGNIRIGEPVEVEGPYGQFIFEDDCDKQVWVAGGIGITPFIARLEYLANHGGSKKPIDFWYCTRGSLDSQFPSSLEHLCTESGVNLTHLDSSKNEYLTAETIKTSIGDLDNTSIWFCGPERFRESIMEGLETTEFKMQNSHYDSFHMR